MIPRLLRLDVRMEIEEVPQQNLAFPRLRGFSFGSRGGGRILRWQITAAVDVWVGPVFLLAQAGSSRAAPAERIGVHGGVGGASG